MEEAKRVFDLINEPNSVSFGAMSKTFVLSMHNLLTDESVNLVNAYGLNGKGEEAIELFYRIPLEMIDDWIYVCVLNACSHSGLIKEGEVIFNRIPQEKRAEKIYSSMVSDTSSLFEFICIVL